MNEDVSPRPWSVQLSDLSERPYVEDGGGLPILFASWLDRRNLRHAAECVNLLDGLDPTNPALAEVIRSLQGMGDADLEMLSDWLKEKGWGE